ncbi:MAG: hypothetical protein ACHREM_28185 [Polyangiales bacterium]
MRKSIVVTLVLCMSALVSSSALALVAANRSSAQTGTPAIEHVKPQPVVEATPPAVKTIAKRRDAFVASKSAATTPAPATKEAPTTVGLDMSTMRCVKRPLSSGKPGETVTVCE